MARRKSVTIKEKPQAVHTELAGQGREAAEGSDGGRAFPRPSSELEPPARSALKKNEDIRFVIQSSDPMGQDTAVYAFNQFQMPIDKHERQDHVRDMWSRVHETERAMARLVARSSVLLARSSGRDKVAGTIQYACMFWQAQPFVNLLGIKDGPEAPWKKIEDSMSSARKVFRLGKWIKEYEKARVALTAPDEMINLTRSRAQALVTRCLAVAMDSFSFLYYVFDNMIWAAQNNLINRAPSEETEELRKLLSSSSTYEAYIALQARHKEATKVRAAADRRVAVWKDCKNYSSLARLIFALVHCTMQVHILRQEQRRIIARYAERIAIARGEHPNFSHSPSPVGAAKPNDRRPGRLERYDSLGSTLCTFCEADVPHLENERDTRVEEIDHAAYEQKQEILACATNLGILLNRLNFPFFKRLPLWIIGLLGVVSNGIGCIKNWPKYVPEPKANEMAKLRSDSFDKPISAPATPTTPPYPAPSAAPKAA